MMNNNAAAPLLLDGHAFEFVCELEPKRNPDGSVHRYAHSKYDGERKLLPYGKGPFCTVKVPWTRTEAGLYALTHQEDVLLVSETEYLAIRLKGYCYIPPAACYTGGQQTNVRINHLLGQAFQAGQSIRLWFHPMRDSSKDQRRAREHHLQAKYNPPWNI